MAAKGEPKLVNPEFTKEVVKRGADTITLCFQCGTCTSGCPSGRITAFRTRKLMRRVQLGFKEDVLPADELWLCTTCMTCDERCPRGVKIVDIIMTLRNMAVEEGYMAEGHKRTASMLVKTGHAIPMTDKFKELRKSLQLDEIPPTVLSDSKLYGEVLKIMKATKFDKLIGE
ncbi:MAG: CoB--CoM heterodisulfide reductase subunit C [Thermoplasmata archaeon]